MPTNLKLIIDLNDIEALKDLSDKVLDFVADSDEVFAIVEKASSATAEDFEEDNLEARAYFEAHTAIAVLVLKEALASLRIGGDNETVTKH